MPSISESKIVVIIDFDSWRGRVGLRKSVGHGGSSDGELRICLRRGHRGSWNWSDHIVVKALLGWGNACQRQRSIVMRLSCAS